MFGRGGGGRDARGDLPALAGFDFGLPAEWGTLPVDSADGEHAAEVPAAVEATGRELTSSDVAHQVFARFAGRLHPVMTRDAHLLLGVWVPDPATGEVWAVMLLDLLVDDGGSGVDRDDWLRRREHEATPNLTRREVEACDVPLGPAVLVVEVARDDVGDLELRVEITVFPHTCRDALQVTVVSPHLAAEDLLIGQAALWADHLTLRLAP